MTAPPAAPSPSLMAADAPRTVVAHVAAQAHDAAQAGAELVRGGASKVCNGKCVGCTCLADDVAPGRNAVRTEAPARSEGARHPTQSLDAGARQLLADTAELGMQLVSAGAKSVCNGKCAGCTCMPDATAPGRAVEQQGEMKAQGVGPEVGGGPTLGAREIAGLLERFEGALGAMVKGEGAVDQKVIAQGMEMVAVGVGVLEAGLGERVREVLGELKGVIGGELVGEGRTPMTEGRTPIADDRLPMAESRSPMTDARSPMAEGRTPIADDRLPMAEGRTPIADERLPMAEGRTPIADERLPMAEGRSPIADERVPMGEGRTPIADERLPMPEGRSPMTDARLPMAESRTPSVDDRLPMPESRPPMTDARSPMAEGRSPLADERPPMPDSRSPVPGNSPKPHAVSAKEGMASPAAPPTDGARMADRPSGSAPRAATTPSSSSQGAPAAVPRQVASGTSPTTPRALAPSAASPVAGLITPASSTLSSASAAKTSTPDVPPRGARPTSGRTVQTSDPVAARASSVRGARATPLTVMLRGTASTAATAAVAPRARSRAATSAPPHRPAQPRARTEIARQTQRGASQNLTQWLALANARRGGSRHDALAWLLELTSSTRQRLGDEVREPDELEESSDTEDGEQHRDEQDGQAEKPQGTPAKIERKPRMQSARPAAC